MSKQAKEAERNLKLLFPDLKSEIPLEKITKNLLHRGIRIDIWIPSINLIIEVHGIQHFKPSGFGKNKVDTVVQFQKQQNRDNKLIEICEQYGINYEQIDYDQDSDYFTLFWRFNKYRENCD